MQKITTSSTSAEVEAYLGGPDNIRIIADNIKTGRQIILNCDLLIQAGKSSGKIICIESTDYSLYEGTTLIASEMHISYIYNSYYKRFTFVIDSSYQVLSWSMSKLSI